MAKLGSINANFSYNSVALEDDLTGVDLNVTVERPVVTALADAGPRRVLGNYDYNASLEGVADFAASQSDATLFAGISSDGAAMAFDPTGNTAGANDPNYDATSVCVESYSISARVGAAITFSATLQGNSALARAVE